MLRVAHLDLDAFYVSVELLRRPELRGRPVVVAGEHPRAVVTTASYEARAFGVGSAIPAARARRLCPQAVFVPPDFEVYREHSRRVMAIVRDAVERVEVVGLDEVYLDLDGLVAPRAAMRRLVGAIERETGLSASVGLGPNKLVAKVASDAEKPRGFVALEREQACERFAGHPPGLLPGIGPKTGERLAGLELETIGALAAAPEALLVDRFGARLGRYLRDRAQFRDDGAVQTERVAVSESRETTFPGDLRDPAEIERILDGLTAKLCAALVEHDRRGRTIGVKVRLDDFSTHTRARSLPGPVNDAATVGEVSRELLRAFLREHARPVRLVGVRVAGLDEDGTARPAPGRKPVPPTQLALGL